MYQTIENQFYIIIWLEHIFFSPSFKCPYIFFSFRTLQGLGMTFFKTKRQCAIYFKYLHEILIHVANQD